MNIEHKPGVLCVIIRGTTPKGKANVGKMVELVRHLEPGDVYMISSTAGMQNADNRSAWLVKGEDLAEPGDPNIEYGLYVQSALLPIKDPDQGFVEDQIFKVSVTIAGQEVKDYAGDTKICI